MTARIKKPGIILLVMVVLAALAQAAPVARRFDITSGAAESALNAFAVQSGLQVLYPTELAAEVTTNAVRGHYTVREALDRMLSDTGLAANYNEQTGLVEITRVQQQKESIVRLPPYTVEGENASWRFARVGQMEILSSCIDDVTHRVIQQLFRLNEALNQIIAPDLLFTSDTPLVYVLHADSGKTAVPQELVERLQQLTQKNSHKSNTAWRVDLMRSYVFWDMDSRGIYFILNEGGMLMGRLSVRRDYLNDMLVRRVPVLPEWFVEGMTELYRTVTLDPYGLETMALGRASGHHLPGGVAKFGTFVWRDDAETYAIRKEHTPDLIPLRELLLEPKLSSSNPNAKAQAALFVRWALDKSEKSRKGLWQLARLAAQQQLTEKDFKECFDIDFATADKSLARYLPKAIRHEFELRPKKFAEMPDYALRPATEMDVALVKGELDRQKIRYVERFAPKLKDRYISQARLTIGRGKELGEDNAKISELLGLCECDAGDDIAALPFLVEAVNRGSARSRVYYELARIKIDALRAQHRPLSVEESNEIWKLLVSATRSTPQLEPVYDLMADVLGADSQVNVGSLERMAEGLSYFPHRVDLAKKVAEELRRLGEPDKAAGVLRRSLEVTADPADRAELVSLLQTLAGSS